MEKGVKEKIGAGLIVGATFLAVAVLFSQDPIPQHPKYHLFADERRILSIPNFWNVISNSLFFVVGSLGLYSLRNKGNLQIADDIKLAYLLLFAGVGLIAVGSAYYHLTPNNATLVWDRLPMSIAFMAIFAVVIGEFISVRLGKVLLIPLILAGIASVLYWYSTEVHGQGDLRFYALVQFLPMLIIPIILCFYRSRFTRPAAYWWLFIAYGVAKVFEHFDTEIYKASMLVSGHTLKHVAAAMGLYILLVSYQKREYTVKGMADEAMPECKKRR